MEVGGVDDPNDIGAERECVLLLDKVRLSSLESVSPTLTSLGVCKLEAAEEADASIGVPGIDALTTSLSEYVAVGEDSVGGKDELDTDPPL